MHRFAAAALAALPFASLADTCPWLGDDAAAQAILAKPTEVKLLSELKGQASRARPAKIDGNPAFFTMNRGFSGGTFAQKGRHFVFVSHVFSPRVKDAMQKDPDGASLSTHEVAKRVLAKL